MLASEHSHFTLDDGISCFCSFQFDCNALRAVSCVCVCASFMFVVVVVFGVSMRLERPGRVDWP